MQQNAERFLTVNHSWKGQDLRESCFPCGQHVNCLQKENNDRT